MNQPQHENCIKPTIVLKQKDIEDLKYIYEKHIKAVEFELIPRLEKIEMEIQVWRKISIFAIISSNKPNWAQQLEAEFSREEEQIRKVARKITATLVEEFKRMV